MHRDVLLDYFNSGMTGVRTVDQKKLAAEVSEKTGLTYQQIKVTVCSQFVHTVRLNAVKFMGLTT